MPYRRGGRRELGISLDDFFALLNQMSFISLVALDELWNVGGEKGDKLSLVDTLEDAKAKDPSKSYEVEERKNILADAIGRLPERERIVVASTITRASPSRRSARCWGSPSPASARCTPRPSCGSRAAWAPPRAPSTSTGSPDAGPGVSYHNTINPAD